MSSWKGKTLGGIWGYKIFVFVLKYFGLYVAYFCLVFVAAYFLLFAPKARKPVYCYFRKIHKHSVFQSYIKTYQNFFVFGQVLLDKMAVLSGFTNKFTYDFEGEEHLRKMIDGNQGGILVGAHVGNWEMAKRIFMDRLNSKINLVMIDEEHQRIKSYLSSQYTSEAELNIIVVNKDLSHIFQINNALKKNEIVSFHGDRYLTGSKTFQHPFLGETTTFPSGPFDVAAKMKVPVSFFFAMKVSAKHYHFFASPIKIYDQQSASEIKNDYIAALENIIKKFPTQWFNYYDFWGNLNK